MSHPKPRVALFLPLFIVLMAAPSRPAADAEPDCSKAVTTADMRACENHRYEQADHQLNEVYTRLIKRLDPARKEKLQRSQRAWLRFRDTNADFLASAAEGGTLAPLLRMSALADMTEARLKELARLPVK